MVFHITSNICVVTGAHCVNTCSARCRRHVRFRWRTANNSVDRERHVTPLYHDRCTHGAQRHWRRPAARLDSTPHLNPSGLHPARFANIFYPGQKPHIASRIRPLCKLWHSTAFSANDVIIQTFYGTQNYCTRVNSKMKILVRNTKHRLSRRHFLWTTRWSIK